MTDAEPKLAAVLIAHGSRDARWAEPFHRVAAAVRAAAPQLPVELAFLEFMTPDLASATKTLADLGATHIRVVPLFLGQGGHLRTDIPAMVADIAAALPGVAVVLAPAAGDDNDVVAALAAFCLKEAKRT